MNTRFRVWVAMAIATCSVFAFAGIAFTQTAGWLDNGIVKVNVDLSRGGTISWLSQSGSGTNVINGCDLGRYVQQSYYSGPVPFQGGYWGSQPWPWNPIAVGDHNGHASTVIATSNNGQQVYTKIIPMQWALNNVPGDCTFEQWVTLDGNAVKIHCKLNNARADTTWYGGHDQEVPAVYTVGALYKAYTYKGTSPFTNDALTELANTSAPEVIAATENWAAQVNGSNWGLGVFKPGNYKFAVAFFGTKGSGGPGDYQTGYTTPFAYDILDYNIAYEYNTTLILGNLTDIRSYVYQHQPSANPNYRFTSDRQRCYYVNATDTGWPIQGGLMVKLNSADPQIMFPQGFWSAASVPKLYIRMALIGTSDTSCQVYFLPNGGAWRSVSFLAIADGQMHTYNVNLASSPDYTGNIIQLRLDPTNGGVSGAFANVDYITSTPPLTGSVAINSGATYCTSTSAILSLLASGAGGSGASQMRFSNDGVSWSGWESYATSKAWTLTSGDGTKTVYIQFKDIVGNISDNITDTIILNTTAPTAGTLMLWQTTVASPDGDGAWSIAVDQSDGSIYVANGGNLHLEKYSKDGVLLWSHGTRIWNIVHNNYYDIAARYPKGMAVDPLTGYLYSTNYNAYLEVTSDKNGSEADPVYQVNEISLNPIMTMPDGTTILRTYGVSFSDDGQKMYIGAEMYTPGLSDVTGARQFIRNNNGTPTDYTDDTWSAGVWMQTGVGDTEPWGVATDRNGKVYISNWSPYGNISRFNSNGTLDISFVNPGGYSTWGICTDADNVLWAGDARLDRHTVYAVKDGETLFSFNTGDLGYVAHAACDRANGRLILAGEAVIGGVWTELLQSWQPGGGISINSGAIYCASTSVTLTLSGSDTDGTGVSHMRFSNDGVSWSGWGSYATSKAWTLASGDGTKTVYVQFRDIAGNTSGNITDSIILDATAPSVPCTPTDAGAFTNSTIVTFNWTASTDSTSGVAGYNCRVGTFPDGIDVFNSYMGNVLSKSIIGSYGNAYYCSVQAKDNAGNLSAWSASNGIVLVEYDGVSISFVKSLPNSATVGLSGNFVTGILGDCLYIEKANRIGGIRVVVSSLPSGIVIGSLVDVGGTLMTNAAGERYIAAGTIETGVAHK